MRGLFAIIGSSLAIYTCQARANPGRLHAILGTEGIAMTDTLVVILLVLIGGSTLYALYRGVLLPLFSPLLRNRQ